MLSRLASRGNGQRPMSTIRLSLAQALVRYLAAERTIVEGGETTSFRGIWPIFGHSNIAALGEALHAARDTRRTFRAHNEQARVHAAIAYTKTLRWLRMTACTTSIGPGATNMVTAVVVAKTNRRSWFAPIAAINTGTYRPGIPEIAARSGIWDLIAGGE